MGLFRRLFGGGEIDGMALATSPDKSEYAQIDLLSRFATPGPLANESEQARWNRVLPQPYGATIRLFEQQGWLTRDGSRYVTTASAAPFVAVYMERLETGRQRALARVRQEIEALDCGEALEIRQQYERSHPLGKSDWSGPEPQLSRSSLTRRILYLNHWLLDGLTPETVEWLKLYAAEQHLWETYWQLPADEIPAGVQAELASDSMEIGEAVYWRAYQLALVVDNQETWQRCKGGDHVRRIEIAGPADEHTCDHCRAALGQQFLVARVPDLPHRACTSSRGCRCRYEPVLVEAPDDGG